MTSQAPRSSHARAALLRACVFCLFLSVALLVGCNDSASPPADIGAQIGTGQFDLLIENGRIYDGSGADPFEADIGITGDRIVAIGNNLGTALRIIDATGLAVAPGFINMLSWATNSLIQDGLSQSDIRQGVTLEVMGEGWSMGPLTEEMKAEYERLSGDIKFDIEWTTLGEYLTYLENRGISTNVASFVGATTIRIHEIGYEDRPPTAEELARMENLVRQAMLEGALGVGSSLIYAPAFYSTTEELIALNRVAAGYGGLYISHIRSEGNRLLEAIDELITIAREAQIGAEIYHLKAAGQSNWDTAQLALDRIEEARASGLDITANMYPYTAGATGLDAAMPPWVQEGGTEAWIERLKDPAIRARVIEEMKQETDEWESLYLAAGDPDNIMLIGFRNPRLKHLTGRRLSEVAAMRGMSAEETIIDLVIEDQSRVDTAYFLMSEDNVRKNIAKRWVAFGSDAESLAPEGVFLKSNPHPRAYGTFARVLGKYVREEKIIPLQEAIRRMTSFPAKNLKLKDRGQLQPGYFADVAIFDANTITDHATFAKPHQYATGMVHVIVNGTPVLLYGEHTGATPGRFIKGPGYSAGEDTAEKLAD